MSKTLVICFFAGSLLVPAAAWGQTAQEMQSACKPIADGVVTEQRIAFERTFSTGQCWGAFATIQSLMVLPASPGNKQSLLGICAPPASSRSQLVAIFLKYAQDNPARLHEEFTDVVLVALRSAFPCKASPPSNPSQMSPPWVWLFI